MEILDLYDDYGTKLNKTIVRGENISDGNIMLSIIFIKNKEGKYLIQKTSKEKGSCFSTTGGHVNHNEDGIVTIIREVYEELGLSINKKDIKVLGLDKIENKPLLFNTYYIELEFDLDDILLQEDEVSDILLLSKDEILELIKNNEFLETHGYLFNKYL